MCVEERLVSELKEALVGELTEKNFSQEVVADKQTDWKVPYTMKKKINSVVKGCLTRPPGMVLMQRQFACLRQTVLRWEQCYAEEIVNTVSLSDYVNLCTRQRAKLFQTFRDHFPSQSYVTF